MRRFLNISRKGDGPQRVSVHNNNRVSSMPAQFKTVTQSLLKRSRERVSRDRNLRKSQVGIRRLKRWFMSLTVTEVARRTWLELGEDFATDQAGAVSYYALLSLFPLVSTLVTVFSLILEGEAVEREVFGFFHTYIPGSEGIMAANVAAVENIRGLLGIISAFGLLWSSSLLFGAITRAVNRAWDIPYDRPFLREKSLHFIMAFSVAPLIVLSMATTAALQFLGNEELPIFGRLAFLEHNGINTLARPVPFVFSLMMFLFIYKFAPFTRTHWRYIWPGALLAALLFDLAKSAFVFYLENYASYDRVYGVLASAIVLLVWIHVSGITLMIGAEVASEYQRLRLGIGRGQPHTSAPGTG